ncbi:MAG: GNAT family N-acetyltransferase [Alphaproteobacteria bacterium]|nr:GNAT family N-acetyltransferase [Alphaproteobacteria bacterium]
MSVHIRDADLTRDKPAFERFIWGSNTYEGLSEPNRRLDAQVGVDFLPEILKRVEKRQGRIFVAEVDGAPVGWAVCHTSEQDVYVLEEERMYGYVAELFVDEEHRGRHIGRSLLNSCEDYFRTLGLKFVFIGALAGNSRAVNAYRAAGFADYAIEFKKRL